MQDISADATEAQRGASHALAAGLTNSAGSATTLITGAPVLTATEVTNAASSTAETATATSITTNAAAQV